MKRSNQILMTLILITVIGVIIDLIFKFYESSSFQKFALIFNDILTPVITAAALVVYWLSLMQMKKQTKSLIEEKEILRSEKIYNDYIITISEIKEVASKQDLSISVPKDVKKDSFSALTIYTRSPIIPLIKKLNEDPVYKIFLQKRPNEIIAKEEFFEFSENEYYISLYSIFNKLYLLLSKINLVLYQIEENRNLFKAHSTLLIKYIAKELLYEYFLLVQNEENCNYYLFNSGHIQQNKKLVFEAFEIESVYNFYRERYPEIIEEVLFLKRPLSWL